MLMGFLLGIGSVYALATYVFTRQMLRDDLTSAPGVPWYVRLMFGVAWLFSPIVVPLQFLILLLVYP